MKICIRTHTIYIHTDIHTYVRTYIHTYDICKYIRTRATNKSVCTRMYARACAYVLGVSVCLPSLVLSFSRPLSLALSVCVCVCVCFGVHICIHIYIYIYIYV